MLFKCRVVFLVCMGRNIDNLKGVFVERLTDNRPSHCDKTKKLNLAIGFLYAKTRRFTLFTSVIM